MSRIEPTPGRVVWFFPKKQTCPGEYPGDGVPLAAIVAFCHEPPKSGHQFLNLALFEKSGMICPRRNVPLMQEGDPVPDGEFCAWMPYQVGQAKKHADAPPAVQVQLAEAVEVLKQRLDAAEFKLAGAARSAPPSVGQTTQSEASPPVTGDRNGEGQQEQGQGQQG